MEANGGPPERGLEEHVARAGDLTEKLIGELRELLAEEEQVHLHLTEKLEASRTRRDRARKALEQLTCEAGKYKTKAAAAKQAKPTKSGTWTVSEKAVGKVLAAVQEVTEPTTMTKLREDLGMASETMRRAMDVLRERELVRITGATRGGGKLYLPMPTPTEEPLADAA